MPGMTRTASPLYPYPQPVPVALRSGRKQIAPRGKASTTSGTLSHVLWGKDFLEHLPYRLSHKHDVEVVRGEWDRVQEFLSWFPELQERPRRGHASNPEVDQAKQVYFESFCDLMECRRRGETIGIFIGAPEDWSTYYCRVLAIRPDLNTRSLLRRFSKECVEAPLRRLGVERLIGETGPSHTAMARLFLELGFHVTGQRLTERWGPLTRYTKFLDASCSEQFRHRYGAERGDRNHRGQPKKGGNP